MQAKHLLKLKSCQNSNVKPLQWYDVLIHFNCFEFKVQALKTSCDF